ncbi:hypothetical protein AB0O87_12115 [Microbacterium sp. NPDC076768]|uniref:hypothetical protein n=1 Tax=Microbacterium sp. NPDC076768 TaxID=3154858 RepID=UPI003449F93D
MPIVHHRDPSLPRKISWQAFAVVTALFASIFIPVAVANAAPGDTVSGVLRVDANGDGAVGTGVDGENDLPLAGVAVALTGSDPASPRLTTTTDSNGAWSFAEEDYTVVAGPYIVELDVSAVNGGVYATFPTASDDNSFVRGGNLSTASSEPFAGGGNIVLDGLVFPAWSLDLALAADPAGYEGLSVYTGAAPWDADSSQPGNDSTAADGTVRTADIVRYNWSLTAAASASVGGTLSDVFFEQTISLGSDARANFASVPAACAGGTIVAYPSGVSILPKGDPPSGTTQVVLTCNIGAMGDATAVRLLPTSVQVSSNSTNGSTFEVTARAYATNTQGVAIAQPSATVSNGPIEITAAPSYDIEKFSGRDNYNGTHTIDGVDVAGLYSYYTIQISTDRVVGVEGLSQPIRVEDSYWGVRTVEGPNGEAVGSHISDLKWYIDQCRASPAGLALGQDYDNTVFGKIEESSIANETNSVRDSGSCTYSRATADTGNYSFEFSGIDTSGATYPTTSANGEVSLEAGPFYVASYRVRIFIPYTELDRMEGEPDDGTGRLSVFNRIGGFDPEGLSGASNYGDENEPGYCEMGSSSDQSSLCINMADGGRSNNVAGPLPVAISPGAWGKYLFDRAPGAYVESDINPLPEASQAHDGAGQVQPGQAFSSRVTIATKGAPIAARMCDVFDNTTLSIAPLSANSAGYPDTMYSVIIPEAVTGAAARAAYQANWQTKYASIDLSGDDVNTGVFDAATDRFEGDWTNQRAATDAESTVCGSPDVEWFDNPNDVPGGIDAVNVVWTQVVGDYVVAPGGAVYWFLTFEQRNEFNGGSRDGEPIPAGTVAANFAQADLGSGWGEAAYVPGAGTAGGAIANTENGSIQGDRWTVVRAALRLATRTVDADVGGIAASGASDFGVTGSAIAGAPVVWEIVPTLTAASGTPAPVENVAVTYTLPEGVAYDAAATADVVGGTTPSSVIANADGSTTLVWSFGTRTPNQGLPVLRIATYTDPLATSDVFPRGGEHPRGFRP